MSASDNSENESSENEIEYRWLTPSLGYGHGYDLLQLLPSPHSPAPSRDEENKKEPNLKTNSKTQVQNKRVVIVRGLPGSGKSTLCSLLARAASESVHSGVDTVRIISADNYFYLGGNVLSRKQIKKLELSKDEVYLRCFDVSRLPAAHQCCHNWFLV